MFIINKSDIEVQRIKSNLINTLLREDYLNEIRFKIEDRNSGKYKFDSCNEAELIYLYVHDTSSLFYKKSKLTKRSYLSELLMFYKDVLTIFGSLKELNAFHVRDYQEYLSKRYSKNTVNKKSTIIKSFLTWLHKIGYLEQDVTHLMKSTSVKLVDQPIKGLEISDIRQLLEYYQDKYFGDYVLLSTLAFTGMRVGELAKAKWGEVIIEEETGEYFLSYLGKGNQKRLVYLHPDLFRNICTYRRSMGLGDDLRRELETPFFPSPFKSFYSANYLSRRVTNLIKEALPEKAKVFPISAHSLRHAYANLLENEGVDLLEIQRALDHKDPRTTLRYLKRTRDMKNHPGKKVKVNTFFKRLNEM